LSFRRLATLTIPLITMACLRQRHAYKTAKNTQTRLRLFGGPNLRLFSGMAMDLCVGKKDGGNNRLVWIPRYVSSLGKYVRTCTTEEPPNACVHEGTAKTGFHSRTSLTTSLLGGAWLSLPRINKRNIRRQHWDLRPARVGASH